MFNRVQGYYDAEEMRVRAAWERTRWQTAALLNVYAKKGQEIKPGDLATFPWEKKVEKINHTELMELAEKRWAKWDAQMQNDG